VVDKLAPGVNRWNLVRVISHVLAELNLELVLLYTRVMGMWFKFWRLTSYQTLLVGPRFELLTVLWIGG